MIFQKYYNQLIEGIQAMSKSQQKDRIYISNHNPESNKITFIKKGDVCSVQPFDNRRDEIDELQSIKRTIVTRQINSNITVQLVSHSEKRNHQVSKQSLCKEKNQSFELDCTIPLKEVTNQNIGIKQKMISKLKELNKKEIQKRIQPNQYENSLIQKRIEFCNKIQRIITYFSRIDSIPEKDQVHPSLEQFYSFLNIRKSTSSQQTCPFSLKFLFQIEYTNKIKLIQELIHQKQQEYLIYRNSSLGQGQYYKIVSFLEREISEIQESYFHYFQSSTVDMLRGKQLQNSISQMKKDFKIMENQIKIDQQKMIIVEQPEKQFDQDELIDMYLNDYHSPNIDKHYGSNEMNPINQIILNLSKKAQKYIEYNSYDNQQMDLESQEIIQNIQNTITVLQTNQLDQVQQNNKGISFQQQKNKSSNSQIQEIGLGASHNIVESYNNIRNVSSLQQIQGFNKLQILKDDIAKSNQENIQCVIQQQKPQQVCSNNLIKDEQKVAEFINLESQPSSSSKINVIESQQYTDKQQLEN